MKNATTYEKKIRKLLGSPPKRALEPVDVASEKAFEFLVEAVLQAEVPRRPARQVIDRLGEEFVDYNELRVAPPKDIQDCMDDDFPCAREKADAIVRALNGIFDHSGSFSLEYMAKMTKRDLRQHLLELGLSPYAAALVTMGLFGGHAIPVDQDLVDTLKMDGYAHGDADLGEVQGFLERIIPQKSDPAAHELLRDYVEKNAKALAQKRRKEGWVRPAAPESPKPPEEFPLVPEAPPPLKPAETPAAAPAKKPAAPARKPKAAPRPARRTKKT